MTESDDTTKKKTPARLPIRIDFVIAESRILDEETGKFGFLLVPDPRAWEKYTVNEVEGYRSKLDGYFVSIDELTSLAKQMVGMPITYKPPDYQDKEEYLRRSKKRLDEDVESK
jgi:hypothetical protein